MTSKYENLRQTTSIHGANAAWLESYYEQYLEDPDSVDANWRAFFRGVQGGQIVTEVPHSPIVARFERLGRERRAVAPEGAEAQLQKAEKQEAVLRLINYHRVRGHQVANLDPLGLAPRMQVPDLDPGFHGLSEADMDTEFSTGTLAVEDRMTLRDILRVLRSVYTETIGAEYMYLTETAEKRWIQQRLESQVFAPKISVERKKEVFQQLVAAEGLERYLHNKYVGQKRFSLEGGDALIPLMDEVMRGCTEAGVEELVIGMAHRGRLNVLVNILGKSPAELFAEFEGKFREEDLQRAGDVKYHLGFSTDVEIGGRRLHVVLAFNPSHLEIVNPVVEGSVRARQTRRNDEKGTQIVPVLMHGDAAFAGQGVVMETLQLSQAKGYATGGTVHIIINNQIGFTMPNPISAEPGTETRTSRYATDIAKMLDAPVFHVNGDDPEAVVFVTRLAVDYRNRFHKDVIIDLCCYRRLGHNEADEPSVTSPRMYRTIKEHPTPMRVYSRRLLEEGTLSEEEAERYQKAYREGLDKGENVARNALGLVGNKYTINWSKYGQGRWDSPAETPVAVKTLQNLWSRLEKLPEGFELNPRVARVWEDRAKMAAGEMPMDWGFAETMAYATLVAEGFSVRLSGQDSRRGTFFHRHASLYDANTGERYTPLRHLSKDRNAFLANDTLLSEEGVLGFEYGYSTTDPDCMVIWEAQFGDFANGAQVLIDQFISSGYAKWGRLCGLAMFLPHGYEGQGPEHSSARLERYLQLCANENMQVCVPSTPAQFFHMIRRQMKRSLRLPLIVMTPKSLLRHKLSVSSLEDLSERGFQTLIDETGDIDAKKVKRLVFCSGKVYYELVQKRDEDGMKDVAIVRLEQLYPFPADLYAETIAGYPAAKEIVWCQEEPENQGAWYQIKHRLEQPLGKSHALLYATRPGSATTASGFPQVHKREQAAVVEAGLRGGASQRKGS
jgi:2-oxoglutarate dehydrogenase E1 component